MKHKIRQILSLVIDMRMSMARDKITKGIECQTIRISSDMTMKSKESKDNMSMKGFKPENKKKKDRKEKKSCSKGNSPFKRTYILNKILQEQQGLTSIRQTVNLMNKYQSKESWNNSNRKKKGEEDNKKIEKDKKLLMMKERRNV